MEAAPPSCPELRRTYPIVANRPDADGRPPQSAWRYCRRALLHRALHRSEKAVRAHSPRRHAHCNPPGSSVMGTLGEVRARDEEGEEEHDVDSTLRCRRYGFAVRPRRCDYGVQRRTHPGQDSGQRDRDAASRIGGSPRIGWAGSPALSRAGRVEAGGGRISTGRLRRRRCRAGRGARSRRELPDLAPRPSAYGRVRPGYDLARSPRVDWRLHAGGGNHGAADYRRFRRRGASTRGA